jgi:hypothetical protein
MANKNKKTKKTEKQRKTNTGLVQKQNKTTKRKIDMRAHLYMRALHQEANLTIKQIHSRFPQYALRSIYRHAKRTDKVDRHDGRHNNKGRPRKLSVRDERAIVRTLKSLRSETSSFTAPRIQQEAELEHVCTRTVRRVLQKHGYRYLQSRKKGLLSLKDKKLRLKFAKDALKFKADFWKNDITF